MRRRDPVRDTGVADLPLRPDEPLRHRGLRDQERSRDLRRTQPAQCPQRQRDPRLQRQGGVAAGEHEPQPVVRHVAGVVGLEPRQPPLQLGGADSFRGAASRGPCCGQSWSARHRACPVRRPAASARSAAGERLLRALLGQLPVTGQADQRGDDPTPLGPVDSARTSHNLRRHSIPALSPSSRIRPPDAWPRSRWPRRDRRS